VLLARRNPGDVIGEMALLDAAPRMASVRSCSVNTKLVSISKEGMDDLLATIATAARALFKVLLERWRQTGAQLRQSERMAQLGTLTAGLAHELNNPAAAVTRSADQLRDATTAYGDAREAAARVGLDEAQTAVADASIDRVRDTGSTLDALERSDREAELEEVMENGGVPDAWRGSWQGPASLQMTFANSRHSSIRLAWQCSTSPRLDSARSRFYTRSTKARRDSRGSPER